MREREEGEGDRMGNPGGTVEELRAKLAEAEREKAQMKQVGIIHVLFGRCLNFC